VQFLNKLQPVALLLLRIAGGLIFFSHGWAKLANTSGTMKGFSGMGFPGWVGVFIGALETAGGVFFILGLFTRPLALLLFIEMLVAIFGVHLKHAAWWDVKSYELALACAGISLGLTAYGAGAASVDYFLFRNRS
jgi:putative oxidoreductase